ncbi:hypothetical protein BGZ46_010932 [Entomortierella lignicola]|nr:hypothetical protein BGZ46_010932 [Entomortierella lignicola]
MESLCRPISPLVTSTTSSTGTTSLRPHSATVALSSSFNTLGPSSQTNPKPIPQGAMSSYTQPTINISSPSSIRTQQVANSMVNESEDSASNSSKFARRGPLMMSHDNSSFGDATRSFGDNMDSPALYRQQFHIQQQAFSPSSQRADGTSVVSPLSLGSGAQLQIAKEGWLWRRGNLLTWKRCYAIGRYRGDTNPGIMTLFKDNEHLFPIKTIDMAECFEVQVKGQDAKATGRFEFKVVTRKEEAWFATDTMSERTGWIDALNSLMAKAVGASLMKLEAKLNNIRQRNNSFEYSRTIAGSQSEEKANMLEEQLQLVQQDSVTREQLLSQREHELERKRIESSLVQLGAWKAAAKVTVNQHYAVRDQLLGRVMKAARTVQELIERARIHLETGSDQITEVINSHLECLRVHASESSLNPASYKMLKSILVGLTVNLDTRSSEIKRILLVVDQYISASKSSTSTSTPASPTLALPPTNFKDRRMSVGSPSHPGPPLSASSPSSNSSVYLIQVRDKYKETLEILEDHSKRLKRILERTDIINPETARRFHEEVRDLLKGLLRLPSYVFAPCLPDSPLPGAADTFYREDLVQIQQKSREFLRRSQNSDDPAVFPPPLLQANGRDGANSPSEESVDEEQIQMLPATPVLEASSTKEAASVSPTPSVRSTPTAKLPLALPAPLSSFLLPEKNAHAASTVDPTQKLRETILPEFDHLSIKQEESLQSMTSLLNQISSVLVSKLSEIKEATAGQRQEFEELKDEIIDVMQLSATDPSAHQRDISALSEIRSKLAEIADQLTKVQSNQGPYGPENNEPYNGNRRLMGLNRNHTTAGNSAAIKTGYSLLQRSASTMISSSYGGAQPFYHTIDSGSRQHLQRVNSTPLQSRLQLPNSASLATGFEGAGTTSEAMSGGKHPKIAGMARLFEDNNVHERQHEYDQESRQYLPQNQEIVSKLDQLLLLLEFVNTAQCRMMAYQDLEFDRSKDQDPGSINDGRMMAVQTHMEEMDRKMNLQMHLLRRLATFQGSNAESVKEESQTTSSAQIQEIDEEGAPRDADDETDPALPSELRSIKPIARLIQPEEDMSFLDVLSRLDLQVIPFVKDQSSRIQELSDQLSGMKRQLDEQQRRQEQSSTPPRSRGLTLNSLNRSNSLGSPAAPVLHSRSPSQTSEIDSPSSWRASLRPSLSVGSNSSFRDRVSSTTANAQSNSTALTSPLSGSSLGSQFNIHDGDLLTRTSDRIADILDKMDSRMGQIVDEQLSRYKKGNRDMLAKVYELLEIGDDETEAQMSTEGRMKSQDLDQTAENSSSNNASAPTTSTSKPDMTHPTQKIQEIEQEALKPVGTKALLKEIVTSLDELHGHQAISKQSQQQWTNDLKETLDQVLRGQEELLSKSVQNRNIDGPEQVTTGPVDPSGSVEKMKSLIQEEAVKPEMSLNEQRDELLEKISKVLSCIQESQADYGSKDAAIREELQEMREWIAKHSSMQTENLREIVFAASAGQSATDATKAIEKVTSSRSIDSESDGVVVGGNGSRCGSEEEYTQVDILDDLDQDSVVQNNSDATPPSSQNHTQSPEGTAKLIHELKDQFEMYTKIHMANISELADNVSGVEKMMRDMSKMVGVRRGGTILRKKEAEQDRAMLAAEVKGTIEEFMTKMNSSPSIPSLIVPPSSSSDQSDDKASPSPPTPTAPTGGLSRSENGLLKYLYQPRRLIVNTEQGAQQSPSSTSATPPSPTVIGKAAAVVGAPMVINTSVSQVDGTSIHSPRSVHSTSMDFSEDEAPSRSMEAQLDIYHDQMAQLYKRKARVEIEVEDLQTEKSRLVTENDELRSQVEQLRKEKQELLLSHRGGSSEETVVDQSTSTATALEKALSDRVAILLQETARLEALKKQLESETA